MRFQTSKVLAFSSSALAMTFALGSPAYAQATQPVTQDEAVQCATLPTPAEREACVQAQARPEGTPEEAGDPATQTAGENAERQAETDAIVVTGSRIRRSPFNTPDPITVIDTELEQKSGENETAEILQTSPVAAGSSQITSVVSAGGFVNNGGVGAQTISLRGLGANRTLVLVNGRRAGPAGTRGQIAGFDLNVIPSTAIQSVEILKSGASSIYGSDAIAGVVNLLTRKATDGIETRLFSSIPFESGGENYSVSAVYGKDFGRGHLIGGFDYNRRNELERGDRSYFQCGEEFIFGPEGQRRDILDPRTNQPRCNENLTGYIFTLSGSVAVPGQTGLTFNVLQFNNPGDRLNEFLPAIPTNTGTFRAPAGFFPVNISGCTATSTAAQLALCQNGTGLLNAQFTPILADETVTPKIDRYTVWLDGAYEITDNVELFGEFLFNKRRTYSDTNQTLFPDGFTGSGSTGTRSPAGFCTAANRLIYPLCDPTKPGDPLSAGFVGNTLIEVVTTIPMYNRTEVDYYRAVGGVRADLGGFLQGWNLNSYVQYSRSDGDYTNSRIFADALELQNYRSRLCNPGEVTRIRKVPCQTISFTDPRILRGEFTPEEQAFLFGEETGNTLYTQLTAEASVAGTLFNLPAGPLGAAFGVQYRRDEIDDTPGLISQAGNVANQSVSGPTRGYGTSKEAFAELEVPLIHNTPFIDNLTLSLSGRVTNAYARRKSKGVGFDRDKDNGNFTYKVGLNWTVNDWLRFRGSYGTSFRTPALFEQFLGETTGFFTQTQVDPCIRYAEKVTAGTLSARIGERCAALGLPGDFPGAGSSATTISTGGIGLLDPETSTAKNFGFVLTPKRGPWGGMRMSFAVDYFDIEVKDQVTRFGAFNTVFACLDSDDYPNDPICSFFDRDLTPGGASFGQIVTIRNPYVNVNSERNRGVDVTARLSQDLGRFGSLSLLAQTTWQIEDRFELFQGFIANSEGELGDPTFVGDFKATWTQGPWSLLYGLNVIGGTSNEEDLRNARSGLVCINSVVRGGPICPVYRIEPQFYHALSLTRDIGKRFTMTIGMNNIFDTAPPRISGSFGPIPNRIGQLPTFGTQYDILGRRAFVSVRAKM